MINYNIFFAILLSIIGFIFGYMIGKYRKIIYHGPDSNNIKKYIYKIGNKYYKFNTEICICPI